MLNWKKLNKGHSRSVSIKKNVLSSFFIKGISILVSLVLVPLTIGYINSEQYGIWLTLASIVAWASFFDIGFGNGLRNKLSACIAQNDFKKGKEYISTTYFFMSLLFLTVIILFEVVTPFIPWAQLLNVPLNTNDILVKTVQIVILFFSLQMVLKTITTVLVATQKPAISSLIDTIGQLVTLVIIYVFTKTVSPSLPLLAIGLGLSPVLVLFFSSLILYNGKYKELSPNLKSINFHLAKDILGLGLKFFIIQIAVLVLYQTTNVIISNVSGPENVTIYNVAYKYFSISMMIFGIIIAPIWSAFTDAYIKSDYTWMQRTYDKLTKIVLLMFLCVFVMLLVSSFVFKLWLGDKVSIPFSMSLIIAIYIAFNIWNSLHSFLINGIGKIELQLYISLFATFLNIPLALFLGHLWGPEGVVASMIIFSILPAILLKIQTNKILSKSAYGIWSK